MIKVLFVCLGNICRSPMAEFLMKDIIKKKGIEKDFYIMSAATSNWEIGNPPHHGTVNKLNELGISVGDKVSTKLTKEDYKNYDYIIGMDDMNIRDILKIIDTDTDKKVFKLLDFCGGGDIADPWYTGDFERTYQDILKGIDGLLKHLNK